MADLTLVTGASGFLGQHVMARLLKDTSADVVGLNGKRDLDLRRDLQVTAALGELRPTRVIHLAYPGSRGIQTSVETPADLVTDMLRMDLNVIHACAQAKVATLLCLGSVCGYPEHTSLPTDESQLWAGYPEPVNAAYGLAKRTQLMLLQAYRQQYDLHGIHLILANLYGPGDRSGHVIPATIAKVRRACVEGGPVIVWGKRTVTRSFLYVEDAAEGIVRALRHYDRPEPLNLCALEEVSMSHLAKAVSRMLGYTGPIEYHADKPTGHLRRRFDTRRLREALDWFPQTPFTQGLEQTITWTLACVAADQGV